MRKNIRSFRHTELLKLTLKNFCRSYVLDITKDAISRNAGIFEYGDVVQDDTRMSDPRISSVFVETKDGYYGKLYNQIATEQDEDGVFLGKSAVLLYENDSYYVFLSSDIIDKNAKENLQGDDLIDVFSSDEATAIYEKYLN